MHLRSSEWIIFFFITGCVISHVFVSYHLSDFSSEPLPEFREDLKEYTLHVFGALEKPGVYHFLKGTRIKDLKKILKCKKNADLRIFKSSRRLKNKEIIYIPYKEDFHLESKS